MNEGDTTVNVEATKDPFLDGYWCCETAKGKREKITAATFEETVYFRFKGENVSALNEFTSKVVEYIDAKNHKEITGSIIAKTEESSYIEELGEKKGLGYKVFELEVNLKKIDEKTKKRGGELVLRVNLETTKYSKIKPFSGTLPINKDDYLNVGPPIKMVKLRVQVFDGVTGEVMKKEKVSSISICEVSDITDTNILKIYFNGWEEQINGDNEVEKYSCKSVQKALNRFYNANPKESDKDVVYQNIESFESMGRLYDLKNYGKENDEFNNATQKNAYNTYLDERAYKDVNRLNTGDKKSEIPPLNVRKLIVDEYNGMCMTDNDGYLYIPIPADKFLNGKEVKISIEFRSYYSFFERTNKDKDLIKNINMNTIKDVKLVQRDSSLFSNTPKKGKTGFKFIYNDNGDSLLKNEYVKKFASLLEGKTGLSNFWMVEHDKSFTIIKNKPSIIINTDKVEINDYSNIDAKKELEKDFSVFFEKEKEKNNAKRWVANDYPLNDPKGWPHLVMFLMTYWPNENEQGKYWIDTLNEIQNDERKTKLKNYIQDDYLVPKIGDGRIHMIAIRKAKSKNKKDNPDEKDNPDNRPNDIFVVVKNDKLVGVFYGSTKPGNPKHTTMLRGQHTNYTIAIIWDWKDMQKNKETGKEEDPNNHAPVLKQGYFNNKWTPVEPKGEGNFNIFIHYGAQGFRKVDNRWGWYYVNSHSEGCQIICGSHNIQSDGTLYTVENLGELSGFRNYQKKNGKLGVYESFYTIYITKEDVWKTGKGKNMDGIKPNAPVVYTLIDESDLKGMAGEKFYYLYRKRVFFKA